MSGEILNAILDLATALALAGGLFFMFVGALGLVRLPDVYCRSHAASKCVTLGILGMLTALVLFTGNVSHAAEEQYATAAEAARASVDESDAEARAAQEIAVESGSADEATTAITTKALLVLAFVFVAAPIGSHMLARAAHRAAVKPWRGTLSDELTEDERAGRA